MEIKEMIYHRKSVRSYTGVPVAEDTIEKIREFSAGSKALYPDLKVRSEIVDSRNVKCILPWITPQVIAVFSEDTPEALENVGFIYQQLDLYMQSLGLGVCWVGMGKVDSEEEKRQKTRDGLEFTIMLAFGYPKDAALRKDKGEFQRKTLAEIADQADERLEPARLAPSSINSQPWYFTHEGDTIHVYCRIQGLFKKALARMNRIDMGIALAQMYVANPETFHFFQIDSPIEIKGYQYTGSFTI